jgi:hypothetical protein
LFLDLYERENHYEVFSSASICIALMAPVEWCSLAVIMYAVLQPPSHGRCIAAVKYHSGAVIRFNFGTWIEMAVCDAGRIFSDKRWPNYVLVVIPES